MTPSHKALIGALLLVAATACQARREAEPAPAITPTPSDKAPAAEEPVATPPAPPPPPTAAAAPAAGLPGSTKEEQKPLPDDALSKESATPRTPEEAQAALARAKTELDTLLGSLGRGGKSAATPLSSGDSRCPDACRAFSSLKRAADAVCRLTAEADARCTRAKDVVKESRARVEACKCASEDG